jgi:Tfp pilus assembly protein PilF
MIAACAQELKQFNQAQYALMKAIELDENQPLAFQVLPLIIIKEDLIFLCFDRV